ncbi:unnamed protein product [Adineta ricciae]|nr:unnamed protein product [Adineta ricciae]
MFEIVEVDETIAQEDKLIRKLKQLRNEGFITEKEFNFCRPRGSQPARIYGLPKVHKAGAPLRPIVSASDTFNYKLAKLLTRQLDHLRKSDSIIKDTFTFVDELRTLKFDNSRIKLISFDITSLFTKVPLNRTIQLILDKMYGPEHTCTYSDLKRDDWCIVCKNRYEMRYLLETTTKETNFIFNDKIYSQTNGIAMGSPLGPLFADIYVNYLEERLLPRLKRNGLLYWKRYVDDTFAIVEKHANVEKIVDILNSFDNDIVFTFEEEKHNCLPFLDILVTRLSTANNPDTSVDKSIEKLNSRLNFELNNLIVSTVDESDMSNDNSIENLNSQPNCQFGKTLAVNLIVPFEDHLDTFDIKLTEQQTIDKTVENSNALSDCEVNITSADRLNLPTISQSNQIDNKFTIQSNCTSNHQPSDKSKENDSSPLNFDVNKPSESNTINKIKNKNNVSYRHNSSRYKFTSTPLIHNPKIVSFVNSLLSSEKKSTNNSIASPPNHDNISNVDITATLTNDVNIQPVNRLTKKSFANLRIDSDKRLISKSCVCDDNDISLVGSISFVDSTANLSQIMNLNTNLKLTHLATSNSHALNKTPDAPLTLHNVNKHSTGIDNSLPCLISTNPTCNNFSITQTNTHTTNTTKLIDSFSTTIYRKPTFTGLLTKWNSFVPHSYKVSTLSSMIYRAIRICSSYQLLHEEFEFIEYISQLNGYPANFVKSQIRKTLNRHIGKLNCTSVCVSKDKMPLDNDSLPNKKQVFLDIPFVGKPTDIFKKQLTKLTKSTDTNVDLLPIQRPPSSLSQYFPLKDPIPKLIKSRVVYELNCSDCDATYVGKTIRHVTKRFHEHGATFNLNQDTNLIPTNSNIDSLPLRRSDRNKNKVVHYFPKTSDEVTARTQSKPTQSAVHQHEINNNHHIDWTNFNILAKDNKNYQLLVKESLLINCLKPNLNRTTSSVPLIVFPEGLVSSKPKVKIRSTLDAISLVDI